MGGGRRHRAESDPINPLTPMGSWGNARAASTVFRERRGWDGGPAPLQPRLPEISAGWENLGDGDGCLSHCPWVGVYETVPKVCICHFLSPSDVVFEGSIVTILTTVKLCWLTSTGGLPAHQELCPGDSPGGPVVKTPSSQCRGTDSITGWGTGSHMPP